MEQTTTEIMYREPDRLAVANIYDRISDPIEAAERLGEWFAKSGMFGCEKSAQGQILALACLCERKSPIEIADTYHIFDGRLSMKSRAILAKFRAAGGRVKWTKSDDKTCDADWTFEGETTRVSFTIADAQRMGLIKPRGAWEKAPDEMLRARCTTRAITMLCPEILVGGGGDHVEDMDATSAPMKPAPNPIAKVIDDDDSNPELMPVPKAERKPSKPVIVEAETVTTPSEPAASEQQAKAAEAIEEGVGNESPQFASDAQIGQIMDIVSDCEEAAVAWLVAKKWIPSADEPTKISPENAVRIIDAPEKFLRAVTKLSEGK